MKESEKTTESGISKYLIWLSAVFCFICIPAVVLSYSVFRYYQTEEEQKELELKNKMQRMVNSMRKDISAEQYFCRFFYNYTSMQLGLGLDHDSVETCVNMLRSLKNYYGERINFACITQSGVLAYNTTPYKFSPREWYNAYIYIKNYTSMVPGERILGGAGRIEDVRKIFGPLVLTDSFRVLYNSSNFGLVWGDSSEKIPPFGAYCLRWGCLFVFADRELLDDFIHLKYIAQAFAQDNDVITGFYDFKNLEKTFWCHDASITADLVSDALKDSELHGQNSVSTDKYYICHQFIKSDLRTFALVKKSNTTSTLWLKALFTFLIYCFISWPIAKYCWNTIVLKIPGTASIRLKLAFLFFFATGIPLLTLAVISHEYELHRRNTLIEEAKNWSIENLSSLESRFNSYLKDLSSGLDSFLEGWSKRLKNDGPTMEVMDELADELEKPKYDCRDFYCIASEAQVIGIPDALVKYSGSLESIKYDFQNSRISKRLKRVKNLYHLFNLRPYLQNDLKSANLIVKKLCSDMNNVPIPSYMLSKLELIIETIVQKSFSEILYSIVEVIGFIREWGFVGNNKMTYFNFLSLYEKRLTDYVVIIAWKPLVLQKMFVDKMLPNANRNLKGFKVFAYNTVDREIYPAAGQRNSNIMKIARNATEKPSEDLEIIDFEGEKYIAVALSCRYLHFFNFVGLYPVRNIDNVIHEQSSLLWILAIFCLVLAAGLAQLLTKSFVNPLFKLQDGALAIEHRNFEHRVEELSKDEFGEVAGILNHVMVGLGELEIAKIVQEAMFPEPEFSQGRFVVYGKSVSMADVGGDYLDFFKLNDEKFVVLLGDVAGHGVGAAVIMAMAKAGILGGGENLSSPAAMLNILHKMILAAKSSKQRKIMTFQYMCLDSNSAQGLYGNAGACSPAIVRRSKGTVEELTMHGAALGGFKKAVYKEMPLEFEPGDAIIFYTDGIVEARNAAGEEMGYKAFFNLLNEVYDADPQKYYENIYAKYLEHIGGMSAQDDLTIVIVICQKSEGESDGQQLQADSRSS